LTDWEDVDWQNRAQFFAIAARIMRNVLVDFARARRQAKRGGDVLRVSLATAANIPQNRSADIIALDEALGALATLSERQSRVVELRFFGGLTIEEIAEVLKVSTGTVRRDWSLARAWLYRELSEERKR
jgi:RNA polymerase sigma factor (TIGR02999 family)